MCIPLTNCQNDFKTLIKGNAVDVLKTEKPVIFFENICIYIGIKHSMANCMAKYPQKCSSFK